MICAFVHMPRAAAVTTYFLKVPLTFRESEFAFSFSLSAVFLHIGLNRQIVCENETKFWFQAFVSV